MIDPVREARRLVDSLGKIGYLVCLGLGGGYAVEAFLRKEHASGLLVIEKDHSTLRSFLENIDLASVLSDMRVAVSVGLQAIKGMLQSTYMPAVSGDLASLAVRPWCALEKDFFDAAAAELQKGAEEARADYSVQAAFGKRWFANMLANLPALEKVPERQFPVNWPPDTLAHVTAAGPSLDLSLPALSARADAGIIIASDTSLPALFRTGIQPDIVMSLDCQVYSYHHFMAGAPRHAALFFDLASPAFLARRGGMQTRFFASAHPFARFIASTWRAFPFVDTTGGNVTHAAVSLAKLLGMSVRLHGADFSYPGAKPYARGTYFYDRFMSQEWRCAPLQSSLASFVFRSPGLTAVSGSTLGITYTTPVLQAYKTRLESLIANPSDPARRDPLVVPLARCSWKSFLGGYREAVRALPSLSEPLGGCLAALNPAQRGLWTTLLPISARFLRETGGVESRAACLEMSRSWALNRAERTLGSEHHGL